MEVRNHRRKPGPHAGLMQEVISDDTRVEVEGQHVHSPTVVGELKVARMGSRHKGFVASREKGLMLGVGGRVRNREIRSHAAMLGGEAFPCPVKKCQSRSEV